MKEPNFTFDDIKSKIGLPAFITIVVVAAIVIIVIITIFVCVCCYQYNVAKRRRRYEEGEEEEENSSDDSEASEYDRRPRSYRHQYDQYIRKATEYDSWQDVQVTICKSPYKQKSAQVDSDTLHAFTYDNHRGYRFQFSTVDSLQLVRCVAQTIADLGEANQNGKMMLEKHHPIYLTLSPYLIYILLDKNEKFEFIKRHNVGLRLNVVEERVRIKPKHCLRWMAPEAAVTQEGTIKSAVFSLSFVLWELLAGKQPLDEQLKRLSRKQSIGQNKQDFLEEDLDARACEMIYQGERPNIEDIFRSRIWIRGRKGPKAADKLEKLLVNCWDPDPDNRMNMSEMERQLGIIIKEVKSGK